MKVEIWSDVVCPWCYVGKRNVEAAMARFPHADRVSVVWRSYELDPSSPPRVGFTLSQILQRKYGMTGAQAEAANRRMTDLAGKVGLEYHLSDVQPGNTFDAHRLVHLAAVHGLGDAMEERLFAAYFTEGRSVSDHDSLIELADEIGLDRVEVVAVLSGDRFGTEVRTDESTASSLGVTGVPFFVIDGTYGVAGAQPPDVILAVLDRAWSEAHRAMSDLGLAGSVDGETGADGACSVPGADQLPGMP